jgi:hypothetical protein
MLPFRVGGEGGGHGRRHVLCFYFLSFKKLTIRYFNYFFNFYFGSDLSTLCCACFHLPYLFIYSFIHLPHSFFIYIYSFIHLFTSFIYLFVYLLIYLLFVYLFIHLIYFSYVCMCIYSMYSFVHGRTALRQLNVRISNFC